MRTSHKFIDFLGVFSSVVIVVMFTFLLYKSGNYFVDAYNYYRGNDGEFYFLSLFIAVVTILAQWIDGRVKYIVQTFRNCKGGAHGRR